MNLTPFEIEFLLHCYAVVDAYPRIGTIAGKNATERFLKDDIIKKTDDTSIYKPTERGENLVRMICETPYPVKTWKDPREMKDNE